MAVIQISKIQVRRGQTYATGMPQLSSGEFGWSIDNQKLYIGNGSVSEGAPEVGNTQVLTEHDLKNLLSGNLGNLIYTYRINDPSNILTGIDANTPTERGMQEKLDDVVSVRDFGAFGDGVSDDTAAIQRAVYELYLNHNPTQPFNRLEIRVPAGLYVLTDTIYLPPYTTLVGHGIDKTWFIGAFDGPMFQTCDMGGTLWPYMAIQAGHVSLSKFSAYTLTESTSTSAMLYLDGGIGNTVSECRFVGTSMEDYPTRGIEIRSAPDSVAYNNKISDCTFNYLYTAVQSDYDLTGITIADSNFANLGHGVRLGLNLADPILGEQTTGPVDVLISNNIFSNVLSNGIRVGNNGDSVPTHVRSANNKFYNVGTDGGSEDSQVYPVIKFDAHGCTSVNDTFGRLEFMITLDDIVGASFQPVIQGPATLETSKVVTKNIDVSAGTYTLFNYPLSPQGGLVDELISGLQNITINYMFAKSTYIRKGILELTVANGDSVVYDRFYTLDNTGGDGGIRFSSTVDEAAGVVTVTFENDGGIGAGEIFYTYKVVQ